MIHGPNILTKIIFNMLRVQLFNSRVGTLVLDTVDPNGLSDVEQIVKRSSSSDGVFYEVTMDLEFFERAYDFIQTVYEAGGIQEIIVVNLYEYDPNAFRWQIYNTGKLALKRYAITETRIKTNIEQTGFETRVQNLSDVDVDIDALLSQGGSGIPATPLVNIPFHPKSILKKYESSPTPDASTLFQSSVFEFAVSSDVGETTRDRNAVIYAQIDNSVPGLNELTQTFVTPLGFLPMGSLSDRLPGTFAKYETLFNSSTYKPTRNPIYVADDGGTLNIDVSIRMKPSFWATNTGGDIDIVHPCESSGALGGTEVFAWFERRDANDNIVTLVQIGEWSTVAGCGGNSIIGSFETKTYLNNSLAINAGDKIFIYATYRVYGGYQPNILTNGEIVHDLEIQIDPTATHINITNSTQFASTTHKTVLIYEVLNKMAQWMTDQTDAFRSDFFGRTDSILPYLTDGAGSLLAMTNGRCLRQLDNQTIFASWADTIASLSARYCLGWGIETDPDTGLQYLRVEPKEYFYNKDLLILELGCVSDLEKSVAMEYYYTQVEFGYPKLDVEQLNGLDEFNTLRRFKTPITETNSKLNISSKVKASGFEIETQRRLIGSSKDSKLDDANFFVSVVRDGLGFRTKKNDGYSVILNLFDSASAYNLDLRPGLMIRAWLKVIASNVTKLVNKSLKFTYGEGNYELIARGAGDVADVDEGEDVDMSGVTPIWEPEKYKFTHPLTRDQMRLIKQNRYGYIRFRDTNNNAKDGYVLDVRHDPNKNMGDFTLLKVFRSAPIT